MYCQFFASHGHCCVRYNISIIPEDSHCLSRSTLNMDLGNRCRQREDIKETISFQQWKHSSDGVTQLFQRVHTDHSPKEKELVFQIFLLGSLRVFGAMQKKSQRCLFANGSSGCMSGLKETVVVVVVIYHEVQLLCFSQKGEASGRAVGTHDQ